MYDKKLQASVYLKKDNFFFLYKKAETKSLSKIFLGQTDIQLFVCQKLLAFRFLSVLIKKKKTKVFKNKPIFSFLSHIEHKKSKKKKN